MLHELGAAMSANGIRDADFLKIPRHEREGLHGCSMGEVQRGFREAGCDVHPMQVASYSWLIDLWCQPIHGDVFFSGGF